MSAARPAQKTTATTVEVGFISELRRAAARQRRRLAGRLRQSSPRPAPAGGGRRDQPAAAVGSMELECHRLACLLGRDRVAIGRSPVIGSMLSAADAASGPRARRRSGLAGGPSVAAAGGSVAAAFDVPQEHLLGELDLAREERPDRLAAVDADDRLGDERRQRDDLDLAAALLRRDRDRVRDDDLAQRPMRRSARRAGSDRTAWVAQAYISVTPSRCEGVDDLDERAGGVDLVVDDDGPLAADVADDVEDLGPVLVADAALLDDGQGRVQQLGEGAGALGEAQVRDHDQVLELLLAEVARTGGGPPSARPPGC